MSNKSLQRNFRLIYAVEFLSNSSFTLPIFILFGKNYLKLSYFQAGSFYIVLFISSVIFDFVGGTIADRFGRKKAFAIGILLQIVGYTPFIFIKSYVPLLFASVIIGIGLALASNSLEALVYEQAQDLGQQKYYQHGNAMQNIYTYIGRIYASIIGGVAYAVHPTLPFLLTIVVMTLALFAGVLTKFEDNIVTKLKDTRTVITKKAIKTYKNNFSLKWFVIVFALTTLLADALWSYYQPYYIKLGVSAATLGYIYSGISAFSAIGSYSMRKLPNRFSGHSINSMTLVLIFITGLILLAMHLPLVYFAPLIMGIGSGFSMPNLRLFVNKHSVNDVRASVLSIATTVMNIGTLLGMTIGYGLSNHSSEVLISIVLTGALLLLLINTLVNPSRKINHSL